MNPLALTWLRRIALGLPLVAATPLAGCWCQGPCPPREETFTITEAQRAMIAGEIGVADGGAGSCGELCEQLDSDRYSEAALGCEVDDSQLLIHCTFDHICPGGRRPAGLLADHGARWREPVGRFLARCAHLEAASVPAFTDLARELALHGAPAALARGARRAAGDEVRHARAIGQLARRFGARPAPVGREATEPRTLCAMAEDNAVEGCTREAYAALLAAHQAAASRDRVVARTYAGIARDEARHALLSFALDGWARSRLPAREARAVDERRRESVLALSRELEAEPAPALRARLGMPDAERSVAMARALA